MYPLKRRAKVRALDEINQTFFQQIPDSQRISPIVETCEQCLHTQIVLQSRLPHKKQRMLPVIIAQSLTKLLQRAVAPVQSKQTHRPGVKQFHAFAVHQRLVEYVKRIFSFSCPPQHFRKPEPVYGFFRHQSNGCPSMPASRFVLSLPPVNLCQGPMKAYSSASSASCQRPSAAKVSPRLNQA